MRAILLLAAATALGQQAPPDPDRFLQHGLEAYRNGDFSAAIERWTEGLRLAESQQDRLFAGTFHGNLALAYTALQQHDRAITHYEPAVEIARAIDDRQGLKTRLNNLGGLYLLQKKAPAAITALTEALELARQSGDDELARGIGNNLGQAYLLNKENLRAAELFRVALAAAEKSKDKRKEAEVTSHLGAAYAAIGNYGQAINQFRRALSLMPADSTEPGDVRLRVLTFARFAEITRDLGDIAAAFAFYESAAEEAKRAGLEEERAGNAKLAAAVAALDEGTPATRERLRVQGLTLMRDRLLAHGLRDMAAQAERGISAAPAPAPLRQPRDRR